jgi:hypothetical protein
MQFPVCVFQHEVTQSGFSDKRGQRVRIESIPIDLQLKMFDSTETPLYTFGSIAFFVCISDKNNHNLCR